MEEPLKLKDLAKYLECFTFRSIMEEYDFEVLEKSWCLIYPNKDNRIAVYDSKSDIIIKQFGCEYSPESGWRKLKSEFDRLDLLAIKEDIGLIYEFRAVIGNRDYNSTIRTVTFNV